MESGVFRHRLQHTCDLRILRNNKGKRKEGVEKEGGVNGVRGVEGKRKETDRRSVSETDRVLYLSKERGKKKITDRVLYLSKERGKKK